MGAKFGLMKVQPVAAWPQLKLFTGCSWTHKQAPQVRKIVEKIGWAPLTVKHFGFVKGFITWEQKTGR